MKLPRRSKDKPEAYHGYLNRNFSNTIFAGSLVILTLLGLVIRSYRLLEFPPSLFIDEYNLGLPALQLIHGVSSLPWYGIGWYGVPAAHIYYIAGVMSLLGTNEWALRMAWVIPASLTVPIVALLMRKNLDIKIALLTAVLIMLSPVHIHLSRWAHGAIITPLIFFAVVTVYVYGKHASNSVIRVIASVLCGILLACMVYTYLGGRVLYVVFWIYALADTMVSSTRHSKTLFSISKYLVGIGITSILILAPFISYAYTHPVEFWGRTDQASILNKSSTLQAKIVALSQNISFYSGMFWNRPDPNPRHTLSPQKPVFGYWFSLLFGLGVFIYWIRNKTHTIPVFILSLGTLLGGILTTEAPSIFRTATVIPIFYGSVAYAIVALHKKNQLLGFLVLCVSAMVISRDVLDMNQILTKPTTDYYNAFTYRETAIARTAYAYSQNGYRVYLAPDFYYYSSVKFMSEKNRKPTSKPYLVYNIGDERNIQNPKTVLIVDVPFISIRDYYKQLWPHAIISVRDENDMPPFVLIEPRLTQEDNLNRKVAPFGLSESWYRDETKSTLVSTSTVPTIYNVWEEEFLRGNASYAQWRGELTIPITGQYTFFGNADDQGGLWLYNANDILKNSPILSIPMASTFQNSVILEKGVYELQAAYKNLGGAKRYLLTVKQDDEAPGILNPLWIKPLPL